jgi:hypothetical protein
MDIKREKSGNINGTLLEGNKCKKKRGIKKCVKWRIKNGVMRKNEEDNEGIFKRICIREDGKKVE